MKINNKWFRAAIPALLIHCSIGTVYYWSTFKEAISCKIINIKLVSNKKVSI